jgi:hypothetical protein
MRGAIGVENVPSRAEAGRTVEVSNVANPRDGPPSSKGSHAGVIVAVLEELPDIGFDTFRFLDSDEHRAPPPGCPLVTP